MDTVIYILPLFASPCCFSVSDATGRNGLTYLAAARGARLIFGPVRRPCRRPLNSGHRRDQARALGARREVVNHSSQVRVLLLKIQS